MVKPRIFVSSTYYDLKHIRNSLRSFIESFGYEAVLFEDGDIPFDHQLPLDESCYSEVIRCHMLVLIIGGRYGSPSSKNEINSDENVDTYKSITVKEYQSARDKDIPIFIFIERNVYSEYRTYKANESNNCLIKYAHVDNVKVFKFIDQINSQQRNNQVCAFDKFDDISNRLRDQWAGLFEEYLRQRQDKKDLSNISSKIDELSQVSEALRTYTESIMKKVIPDDYKEIIETEYKKGETTLNKKRFYESKVVKFIYHYAKIFNINVTNDEIYNKFMRTNGLKEFLESISFHEEFVSLYISDSLIEDYNYFVSLLKGK